MLSGADICIVLIALPPSASDLYGKPIHHDGCVGRGLKSGLDFNLPVALW